MEKIAKKRMADIYCQPLKPACSTIFAIKYKLGVFVSVSPFSYNSEHVHLIKDLKVQINPYFLPTTPLTYIAKETLGTFMECAKQIKAATNRKISGAHLCFSACQVFLIVEKTAFLFYFNEMASQIVHTMYHLKTSLTQPQLMP